MTYLIRHSIVEQYQSHLPRNAHNTKTHKGQTPGH